MTTIARELFRLADQIQHRDAYYDEMGPLKNFAIREDLAHWSEILGILARNIQRLEEIINENRR